MKFNTLDLHEDILRGIADAGFERCTPVQEQSLTECLSGTDMIIQAKTGSGKTAVFVLTIFQRLMAEDRSGSGRPSALILSPTRELAHQISDDVRKLGKYLPLTTVLIYGGVGYEDQISGLESGADIVAATPGRLIDLYKSGRVSFDSLDILVIDEADRMFDMGFAPDIRYIADRMPKGRARQTMLFSATIDSNVLRLSSRYLKDDLSMVEVESEQVTVNTIEQRIIYVSNEEKMPVLITLLKRPDAVRVIVFTNTKRAAEMIEWKLKKNGIDARLLTGDLSQSRREKVTRDMKSGNVRVLVATDVAARGLHIDDVSHVINYDLPEDPSSYVHRVGRTARVGKSGKAYSLACESHVLNLPQIEEFIEQTIEPEWVEESEMAEDKSADFPRPRRGPPKRSARPAPRRSTGSVSRPRSGMGDKTASTERPPQKAGAATKRSYKGKGRAEPARATSAGSSSGRRVGSSPKPGRSKTAKGTAGLSREDRLEYYKKKYGEDFTANGASGSKTAKAKSRGGGVINKLFGVFRKKR